MLDFLWRLMRLANSTWLYLCRSQLKKWHERDIFFGGNMKLVQLVKDFFLQTNSHTVPGLTRKIQHVSLIFVHGRFNLSCQLQTCQDISYTPSMMLNFLDSKHQDMQSNTYLHNVANPGPPPVYIKINLKHQSILSTKCWPFITC